MSGLDIFALVVLFILLFSAVAIWVVLAMLPGKIAARRNHPQTDAITVGGWVGAIFGGVFWPIFFVWAFVKPSASAAELHALRERVASVEAGQGGQAK